MDLDALQTVAKQLVAHSKGILAADESTGTIGKRFEKIGVENTEDNRRAYRDLLFTATGFSRYISGVILYDETIRQFSLSGAPFVKILNDEGVIPGIKVDLGTVAFKNSPVEKCTIGLDGLATRLKEYYKMGARFAKWRAVFTITNDLPSAELIKQNAHDLAEYAHICQSENIVPIVEPEVLMDGGHTIERCFEVTNQVLTAVFAALKEKKVALSGMLLKPNMVLAGSEASQQPSPNDVAEMTIKCFKAAVPAEVPGIVFLSGGQSEDQSCDTLNSIQKVKGDSPWELSYSYGRALQASALKAWGGKPENVPAAQEAFTNRAKLASLARDGMYQ